MLTIENFSFEFPQKDLYHNISFTLEAGDHAAFIGSSGSGKSTLIDIIMRPDDYMYEGKLERAPECRIGYVSQFSELTPDTTSTVFEYIAAPFLTLQNKIEDLCVEMGTAEDIEPLLLAYQEALDAFEAIGGDNYESLILKKLNLAELSAQEKLVVSKLSGGEFKLKIGRAHV